MVNKFLNTKLVVNKPVLVTFMRGPNADESESLTETQLKDKGTVHVPIKLQHIKIKIIWCIRRINASSGNSPHDIKWHVIVVTS